MTKKGGVQQLQAEIAHDDELDKFLEREGILVLDVYSNWAGPCIGMVGYLKKAKLEIGGDFLHLAICKCDTIDKLTRFRNRSEPTWLFCSNKKIINMLLGTNVPKLMAIIIQELKLEEKYKAGEYERIFYEFDQLLPEEQEREVIKTQLEEETRRIETEQAIQQRKEYIHHVTSQIMENITDMAITIFFPHVMKEAYRKTADIADKMELTCKDRKCIKIKQEMLEVLFYEVDNPWTDELINYMLNKEILIFLWKLGETDTRAPEEVLGVFYRTIAEPIIIYDESGEKLLQNTPAILEPLECVPGHEPIIVEKSSIGNRRVSSVPKHHVQQVVQQALPIIDEATGEPLKKIKIPACWTPKNRRANAAFIYIFFRNYTEHFLPPDVPPIPQHLLFVFDAYKRQNILDSCKPYEEDVLAYGFFSSEDITTCILLAKTCEKYDPLKPTVNDKMMLKIAKKRSDIVKILNQMGPCYVSKNTVDGKTDCARLFPDDYNVPEEVPEEESCENESKKKKRKRRKKRDKTEGDADQSQSITVDQISTQDSEDTLDDLSADDDELNHDDKTDNPEADKAPPPSPNP